MLEAEKKEFNKELISLAIPLALQAVFLLFSSCLPTCILKN